MVEVVGTIGGDKHVPIRAFGVGNRVGDLKEKTKQKTNKTLKQNRKEE